LTAKKPWSCCKSTRNETRTNENKTRINENKARISKNKVRIDETVTKREMIMYKRILYQEPALNELKKEYTFIDMHVHTKYSHDSLTNIPLLLKKAAQHKIGIAITDHVRAEGALKAARQRKVLVIPGIEVNTKENKELLLYFYSVKDLEEFYEKYIREELTYRKHSRYHLVDTVKAFKIGLGMDELVEEADEYACLKSIPHPYTFPRRRSHRFFDKNKRAGTMRKIDAIEVLNASMLPRMNRQATNWAIRKGKSFTGGSDAHIASELGHALTASKADTVEEFLDCIRKEKNFVLGKEIKFSRAARNYRKAMKIKRHKNLGFNSNEF